MFKLTKKTEYALAALQYIALHPNKTVSAKQIADSLDISFDFIAKILQDLLKKGIIESKQGYKGGYYLARSADDINLEEVMRAIDGDAAIVSCLTTDDESCGRKEICTIRGGIKLLQKDVSSLLRKTTIADFTARVN